MKSQKTRLESLNPRLRNFPRKVPRTEEKRGRGMTLIPRKTHVPSTVQSVRPKEVLSGATIPKIVES